MVEYGNNLVSARNDWVSDMGSMLDNAIADVKDKLNSDSITNYERVELEAELREFDFMDPYDYGESVNSDVIEYFDTVSYDVSYGEYVDYVEYLGGFFPEDQEFISMVYEITDYGVTNIKDGDVYEGDWINNLPNGKGKFYWPNGTVYEGDWVNNNRSGYGEIYYAKTDEKGRKSYKGKWFNDKQNGKGTMVFWKGRKQKGRFKDNQFQN